MMLKVFFAVALVLVSATVVPAQEKDDASVRSLAASLELELEVTDRLQFREREAVLDLAGGLDGSKWRGTLEIGHESGVSELRIQPGIARKFGPAWIGLGVVLPQAASSTSSLVLEAAFDF